jgi:nucleotide-binding universal stress UspA family protein
VVSRILVANDGSDGGYLALDRAIEVAKKYKAELHMIIIEEFPIYAADMEVGAWIDSLHENCLEVVQKSLQVAKKKRITLEPHLVKGFPVSTISEFTEQYNFDLLVVGFMKHSAFYRWFVGSTTDGMVNYVPCSVLVVK